MNNDPAPSPRLTQDSRWRVADLVRANRELIKQSFRDQIDSSARAYYDSSDFFSTVQRRADLIASLETLAGGEDVRRLLHDIMLEALADHARTALRDRRLRRELAREARSEPPPSAPPPSVRTDDGRIEKLHFTAEELNLARFRAGGMLHRQVAQALGVSAATARARWQRLVGKARETWSPAGE